MGYLLILGEMDCNWVTPKTTKMLSQSVEEVYFNIRDLNNAYALNCMKYFVTD